MLAVDVPVVTGATTVGLYAATAESVVDIPISHNVPTQTSTGNSGSIATSIPTSVTSTTSQSLLYGNRTVARPVANLGNTCYINAVLQALAHAPELCLAMDCEPHSDRCPIAAANRIKLGMNENDSVIQPGTLSRSNSYPLPSPSSSPENSLVPTGTLLLNNTASTQAVHVNGTGNGAQGGGRKTRRGGRRSPRLGEVDGGSSGGLVSSGAGNGDMQYSSSGKGMYADGKLEFCALCEIEKHIRRVHDDSSTLQRERPVAPESFVHGFFHSVAPPWFKLGIQEDSHEFLRLLIDAMQKSCRKARSLTSDSAFDSDTIVDRNVSMYSEGGHTAESHKTPDPVVEKATNSVDDTTDASSFVNSSSDIEYPFTLFRGMVESKVVCGNCGATSSTLDPIEDVGLEVTSFDRTLGGGSTAGSNSFPVLTESAASGRTSRSSVNAVVADTQPNSALNLLDVQTSFQRYASAEALDSGYKCEKCCKVGRATKQSRLASIPPILTLHLKRFRYGGADSRGPGNGSNSNSGQGNVANPLPTRTTRSTRSSEVCQLMGTSEYYAVGKSGSSKIDGHVKFDPVIDLRPYVTEELQNQHPSLVCRLFAVIVHAGKNSHSGHYIAYVQNVTKKDWYKMDDSRVTRVTLSEVLNAEAYMLFYRIVKHPIAGELEDLFRKRLDEGLIQRQARRDAIRSTVEEKIALTVEESSNISRSSKSAKKRPHVDIIEECAKPAEEWVLNQTRMPLSVLGMVRTAQNVLASTMQLTAVGREKLLKTVDGPSSPRSIITDDCIVGGIDMYRQKMIRVFYDLVRKQNEKEAASNCDTTQVDFFTDWFTPTASDNAETVLGDVLVNSDEKALRYLENGPSLLNQKNHDHMTKGRIISRVVLEKPEDVVGLL